jgi:hypothetical protein
MEHGVGEMLQGNVRPEGVMIQSWPDTPFFRIEAGEPAMTIVPNLLASGALTILVSVGFLVWAVGFAHRRHGGLVLVGLSILLLLIGGGFGPPLLGIIVGLAATRIGAPLIWWRTRLAPAIRRPLATSCPAAFVACLGAWLLLVPGLPILSYTLGVEDPALVGALFVAALGLLALTIVAALARDAGLGRTALAEDRVVGRVVRLTASARARGVAGRARPDRGQPSPAAR